MVRQVAKFARLCVSENLPVYQVNDIITRRDMWDEFSLLSVVRVDIVGNRTSSVAHSGPGVSQEAYRLINGHIAALGKKHLVPKRSFTHHPEFHDTVAKQSNHRINKLVVDFF